MGHFLDITELKLYFNIILMHAIHLTFLLFSMFTLCVARIRVILFATYQVRFFYILSLKWAKISNLQVHSRSRTTNYSSYFFYNTCYGKKKNLILMILPYSSPPRTCVYHGGAVKIAPHIAERMSAWNSISQKEGRLWPLKVQPLSKTAISPRSYLLLFYKTNPFYRISQRYLYVSMWKGWGCHLGFLQPIMTVVRPGSKLARVSPERVA